MYRIDVTRRARKELETAKKNGCGVEINKILKVVERDPFEPTPGHRFEKLVGELKDHYSRRINYHNRFIYTVLPNTEGAKDIYGKPYEGVVRIHKCWEHKYKR
jgi:Txe/YoeB family toxin of toxin-antitoxin system